MTSQENELLKNYSKELELFEMLTLESLIDSHRRQRDIIKSYMSDTRNNIARGFEAGVQMGKDHVRDTHVSREEVATAIKNLQNLLGFET